MAGPVQPCFSQRCGRAMQRQTSCEHPQEMQQVIEAAGFRQHTRDIIPVIPRQQPTTPVMARSIVDLVMGDAAAAIDQASERNFNEGRIVMVHAVFDRL